MDLPPVNDISYNRFLKEEKLMGSRCRRCNARFVPPRPLCTGCHLADMEWFEATGSGHLAAFTSINIVPPKMEAFGFGRSNPYVSGVVELEGGGRVDARIVGVDARQPETIRVGMRLKATFLHETAEGISHTSLAFTPDE